MRGQRWGQLCPSAAHTYGLVAGIGGQVQNILINRYRISDWLIEIIFSGNRWKEEWSTTPRPNIWHGFLLFFSLIVFITIVFSVTGYIHSGWDIEVTIRIFILFFIIMILSFGIVLSIVIDTDFDRISKTFEEPFEVVLSNISQALDDIGLQYTSCSAKEYRKSGTNLKLRRWSIYGNSKWVCYEPSIGNLIILANNWSTKSALVIFVCIYYNEEIESKLIDSLTNAIDSNG
jgi:hypothetical protein